MNPADYISRHPLQDQPLHERKIAEEYTVCIKIIRIQL